MADRPLGLADQASFLEPQRVAADPDPRGLSGRRNSTSSPVRSGVPESAPFARPIPGQRWPARVPLCPLPSLPRGDTQNQVRCECAPFPVRRSHRRLSSRVPGRSQRRADTLSPPSGTRPSAGGYRPLGCWLGPLSDGGVCYGHSPPPTGRRRSACSPATAPFPAIGTPTMTSPLLLRCRSLLGRGPPAGRAVSVRTDRRSCPRLPARALRPFRPVRVGSVHSLVPLSHSSTPASHGCWLLVSPGSCPESLGS